MRNLEVIEKELAAARETLSSVEGTRAEVYSRIVGYYRSVQNWNKGKRQEYSERRLYQADTISDRAALAAPYFAVQKNTSTAPTTVGVPTTAVLPTTVGVSAAANKEGSEMLLLLFVRAACPACNPAKAAAGRLGIPVSLVNADTTEGMEEATRRNVMSTPTAILIKASGEELRRARDAQAIDSLLIAEPIAV
jgi:ribonucleoside-triphosphate reductase